MGYISSPAAERGGRSVRDERVVPGLLPQPSATKVALTSTASSKATSTSRRNAVRPVDRLAQWQVMCTRVTVCASTGNWVDAPASTVQVSPEGLTGETVVVPVATLKNRSEPLRLDWIVFEYSKE